MSARRDVLVLAQPSLYRIVNICDSYLGCILTSPADQRASSTPKPSVLASLDMWMASNPWHPRTLPYVLFLLMVLVISLAEKWLIAAVVPLQVVQMGLMAWLLWRYRRSLPELNWRFHWLAVPTAVGLCAVWVGLGHLMVYAWPQRFAPIEGAHVLDRLPALWRWASLAVQMLGMTLVVPMFEEVFIRSACLRGLHSPRKTWIAISQVASDTPVIDEWLMKTRYGRRIERYPAMFTRQLREWPVGRLTWFGVCASTAIFMVGHLRRDWPAAIVCGVVWCALLWWTNWRRIGKGSATAGQDQQGGRQPLGLGPVVWSHAITNALLVVWCVATRQWWFL